MAYSLKKLGLKLKDRGLDVAEEALKAVVEETIDWVAESAVESKNKLDDILVPVLLMAKPHILKAVDKIDGEEG